MMTSYYNKIGQAEAKVKAKAKIQEDSKKIESLNWANEDGEDALIVFPKELWTMILAYVATPKDLENARYTCTLFEEILEPRRFCEILFPSALQVKAFRDVLQEKHESEGRKSHPILELRGVCKGWRDHVDAVLGESLEQHKMSYDERHKRAAPAFPRPLMIPRPARFTEAGVLQNLIASFTPGETSPERFVSRVMSVYLTPSGEMRLLEFGFLPNFATRVKAFNNAFLQLLKLIGSQVWNFNFYGILTETMLGNGVSLAELYKMIHGWVTWMPNLKFLDLSILPMDEDMCMLLGARPVQLRATIQERPFPRLPSLKKIKIAWQNDSSLIYEAVLTQNLHVKHLAIEGQYEATTTSLPEVIRSLPLESVSIRVPCAPGAFQGDIRDIVNSNWQLHTMRISIVANHNAHRDVQMPEVFRFLEQFQTLKQVYLNLFNVNLNGNNGYLELPNLTYFNFNYGHDLLDEHLGVSHSNPYYYQTFEYLLRSRRLQKVTWFHYPITKMVHDRTLNLTPEENCVVQFRSEETNGRSLCRTNLWDVFPYMEELEMMDQIKDNSTTTNLFKRGGANLPRFVVT